MSNWNTIVSNSEWWTAWQGLHASQANIIADGQQTKSEVETTKKINSEICKVVHFQIRIIEQKPIPISWLMFVG